MPIQCTYADVSNDQESSVSSLGRCSTVGAVPESAVLEIPAESEGFSPPTPWSSFEDDNFPSRAPRRKRRVQRSKLASEPKTYPAPRKLMDLPPEILHMIFRIVSYAPQLRVRFLKRSRTLIIPHPHSILVSRKFFEYSKAAKADVLSQAMVVLREEDFGHERYLPINFHPDFGLIQNLTAQHCWSDSSIKNLKVLFASALRLRTVTVEGPSISASGNFQQWTSISHDAHGDWNWFTAVPGPNFQQDIKREVEDNLLRALHPRLIYEHSAAAVALEAWLSRGKEFELRLKFNVRGCKYFRTPQRPPWRYKDRHLWDVTFSTHEQYLKIGPGEGNHIRERGEQESDITTDPALFDRLCDSSACLELLDKIRNNYDVERPAWDNIFEGMHLHDYSFYAK
ncbi:uncharacterized protein AB675_7275 [Cyphellophora attinorum]|uniref:Uncharacterized protein n=1 Tax=Cyphellophora attinorum TaxID=1664694 RepID=A0A0N1GZB7_9EURO|nr:uncharacterized protein AB675_7275 [Phialophora attinorum]KPI36342.1 hypothetical protein AB675_7275 [Phialophora attinorum]